jgi:hypothetical protein
MGSWLNAVRSRLAAASFVLLDEVEFEGRKFPLVARRSRFELTKFGFSESFFIFAEFDRLTTGALQAFSADAYRCAMHQRVIRLPCGLFESVWCYAVAIADAVGEQTLASVRSDTPPKHWASAEIPAVYDVAQRKLFYFERTPLWGAAYYAGFRKQLQRLLE